MERQEFDKLLEAHYRENFDRMVKMLSRKAGQQANAQDVVQDGYVRALEYSGTFDDSLDFGDWMNTIFQNSLKDFLKVERRRGMTLETAARAVQRSQPDVTKQIEVGEYDVFINERSWLEQEILRSHFYKQETIREIADKLHIGQTGVYRVVETFRNSLPE